MPTRVVQNAPDLSLILFVVDAITDNRITRPLVLIRHCAGRLAPAGLRNLRRRMTRQPAQMLLTTMSLLGAEPMAELNTEIDAKCAEPLVVCQALTDPNRTRMFWIADGQVAVLRRGTLAERRGSEVRLLATAYSCDGQNPVRSIEQLRRLQNHLDNVLIAVPARTARRLLRKKEDVHPF